MRLKLMEKLFLIFFVIFLLVSVLLFFRIYYKASSYTSLPISSRQITQKHSSLQELWRQNAWVPDSFPPKPPRLVTTNSTVISANYDADSLRDQLKILDVETGHLISEITLPPDVAVDTLTVRDEHLYIAANKEIQAYQLPDGQRLWSTPGEPRQRSGYDLTWLDENLVNYSSVLGEDYELMSVYDPTTGGLIQRTQIPVDPLPLLIINKTVYKGNCYKLWAIEQSSGREKWQTKLKGCFQRWPALVGANLLVATYQAYRSTAGLYLIDTTNGKIKWSALEDDLVSNFAVIDKTVYAIQRNGDIVGLDFETGRQIEMIKFNPEQTTPNKNAYWVVSSGRKLFAYYGDSRELIAFGR